VRSRDRPATEERTELHELFRSIVGEDCQAVLLSRQRFFCELLVHHFARARTLEVIETIQSPRQALPICNEIEPEIMLADAALFDDGLMKLLKALRRRQARTRTILFNGAKDHASLRQALQAGVTAYLAWDASVGELTQALDAVSQGIIFPTAARQGRPSALSSAGGCATLASMLNNLGPFSVWKPSVRGGAHPVK
jgi:DNA-binding NarL/FixJ family response regulator